MTVLFVVLVLIALVVFHELGVIERNSRASTDLLFERQRRAQIERDQ